MASFFSVLAGRMAINLDIAENYTWSDVNAIAGVSHLSPGGVWKPVECKSRQQMLVVIPYRNRENHLRGVLAHLHPILQMQQLSYRILVVEQVRCRLVDSTLIPFWHHEICHMQRNPEIFNKAALMNSAVVEAMARWWDETDCITFHDVDTLMEDGRNLIRCGAHPVHYGLAVDRMNYEYAQLQYSDLMSRIYSRLQ